MPRYVTQFAIDAAAWAGLAATPAERAAALRDRLNEQGVGLVDLYQAFGGVYDGTAVYDAADDAGAAGAAAILRALGPGEAERTIRLRPGEHQRDALRAASLPPAPDRRPGRAAPELQGDAAGPPAALATGAR